MEWHAFGKKFTFVDPRGREVPVARVLLAKLRLFEERPDLTAKGRYTITSRVDREVVDLFFARLMGDGAEVVTSDNAEQLRALCNELGFAGFDDEIRASLGGDWKVRKDLLGLRGRVDRHDVVIEELQRRVLELERQLREQRVVERVEAVEKRVIDVEGAVAEASREGVERPGSTVGEKASAVDVAALSEDVSRLKEAEAKRATTDPARSEFAYDSWRPLDGIIAQLTRECGGDVHKEGVVKVTGSGIFRGHVPENAVDLQSDSFFFSNDSPNSWICYDFGGRRVTPTSYSIRSYNWGRGGPHPKSWVLEVSSDGSKGSWEVVDSRENNEYLNGSLLTRNFAIGARPSEAFRFVRLRQTGENHAGNDLLVISALELFGALSRE